MSQTFKDVHNRCMAAWDSALQSGDIGALSHYPIEDYQGIFGYKGSAYVDSTSKEEAVSGLKQLLEYASGGSHRWDNRVIKMRNEEEAVVSYERYVKKGESIDMTFFVLQTWRVINGEWRLLREITENI